MRNLAVSLIASAMLVGCGGGGGGSTSSTPPVNNTPSACSTVAGQNDQVLSFLREEYFWYQDLPQNVDTSAYASPAAMMEAIKVPQDRFSFIMSEQQYNDVFINASFLGYGFSHRADVSGQSLQVRYVFDGSGADDVGLKRGDKITEIDGVAVSTILNQIEAEVLTWSDVFGPDENGVITSIKWIRPDFTEGQGNMVKEQVATNTVMATEVIDNQSVGEIGYLVFDQFIERSAQDLNQAFDQFKLEGVNELVLDLRYNGGGQIDIANQLSTQIAGSNVAGQTFINYQFNDKNTSNNTTVAFAIGAGIEQLNLDRVVILTTEETCSASEMVANSLSPFVDVVRIGSQTCGKPVGMVPTEICNNFVLAINFQTTNALDSGDYFDGLEPFCNAADTIPGDWGDPNDPLLSEAVHYLETGSCSSSNSGFAPQSIKRQQLDYTQGPRKLRNDT